jgi:ribosomal protein L37E
MEIKCKKCGEVRTHKAKGYCEYCYKKFLWKPKQIICKRCGREMPYHAKGLCGGCFNFVFRLNENKAWNNKKRHNIDTDTYKRITKTCVICGFDKVVDLHHLDESRENNSESNLVGLCPNHHKMLHDFRYKEEMFNLLREKGISVPKDIKLGYKRPV